MLHNAGTQDAGQLSANYQEAHRTDCGCGQIPSIQRVMMHSVSNFVENCSTMQALKMLANFQQTTRRPAGPIATMERTQSVQKRLHPHLNLNRRAVESMSIPTIGRALCPLLAEQYNPACQPGLTKARTQRLGWCRAGKCFAATHFPPQSSPEVLNLLKVENFARRLGWEVCCSNTEHMAHCQLCTTVKVCAVGGTSATLPVSCVSRVQ